MTPRCKVSGYERVYQSLRLQIDLTCGGMKEKSLAIAEGATSLFFRAQWCSHN